MEYLKISNILLEILDFSIGKNKKPTGCYVRNATKLSFRKEKSQKDSPIKINIPKQFKKQLKTLRDQIQSKCPL